MRKRRTLLVSRATGRDGAHGAGSVGGSISDDGQTIAFASEATNLDPADTDPAIDVYVRQHVWARPPARPTTRLVSRRDGSKGAKAEVPSPSAKVSGDGRIVAFFSQAPLDAADTDPGFDVYVRHLSRSETTLVSRAAGATSAVANGHSFAPSISQAGRFVAIASSATNLQADDTDPVEDVYVRDLTANTIELASRAGGCSGAKGNDTSREPAISGDGRVVAFESHARNLDPDDTDLETDVYLRRLARPGHPVCEP